MQKKIFIISLLLLSFGLTNDLDAQISQDNQIALQFADVSEFKALRLKGSETNLEILEINNTKVKLVKDLKRVLEKKRWRSRQQWRITVQRKDRVFTAVIEG